MKQQKPILHARDHLPGGADPLPQLPINGEPPPGRIDTEIPKHGTPPPGAPALPWFWWRCRETGEEPHPPGTAFRIHSPEENTHSAANQMLLSWYGQLGIPLHAPTDEVFSGSDGPNSDSRALLRLRDSTVNPDGDFRGACALGSVSFPPGYTANMGKGATFTLLGWFNFVLTHNWDIFNLDPTGGTDFNRTTLLLNANGSVSLKRWGSTYTSAAGLVQAGTWAYIGIAIGAGRVKVYVNPGPPEPTAPNPAYGTAFPFDVPMVMETWGLENGDYTADQLAARLNGNGFKTVAVQLNGDVRPGSGRTHADYIAQLADDVATLQAAGIQVIGWGVVDSTTAADLTATGVAGWMPQIEGPDQYTALNSALDAGVGAGLPKALVTTYAGLDAGKVATLAGKGITSAAVESYAEAGYPYNDLNRMLWQGTQIGFDQSKLIPMVGTYRGETPDDYTGLDENVLPNYGMYNAPQTSEAGWAAFAELNQGLLMLSSPVIDVADVATAAQNCVMSVGAPNLPTPPVGTQGAFDGYFSEIVLYWKTLASSDHRSLSMSGAHGDTGVIPPQDQIPSGALQPSQIAPGTDGQHLVTAGGTTAWAADTGGGGAVEYENVWSAAVSYQAGDVVTYNGIDYLAVNPSTGQTPPIAVAGIPYSEKAAASGVASLDASGHVPRAQLGSEIFYGEVTSVQNSTAGSSALAVQVIAGSAISYDGSPVIVEFFCPSTVHSVANGRALFNLYDGGTDMGYLANIICSPIAGDGADFAYAKRRLTPLGLHTYNIRLWTPAGGMTYMIAGSGGSGSYLPAFLRIERA